MFLLGSLKQESFVVVNEDSNRLIFINKADKQAYESCFTIDGVFNLDTGQDKLFLEHLQPLLVMVPLGYSISLLVCEGHHCGLQAKTKSFVQRVIESVFQETSSPENTAQSRHTISFVQIYADGTALDLLSPRNETLQVMDVPPLGLVVEEATEIIVTDSQAATHFYLQGVSVNRNCLQQTCQKQHRAICGLLFTIITEVKVTGGHGFQRATVRILEFSGGDEQCYTDPFFTLSRASSAVGLPAEAGCFSWILKHLLEGNALTFLLLCLTLPDTSGEEIFSALSLTEQVRAIIKTVTPIYWDPTLEARKRRAVIRELRVKPFLHSQMEQDSVLIQLGKVIKELQVLKGQNWEKKEERSAYELKDTSVEVKAGEQHQDSKLKFSLLKTRRQHLQEQHRLLIQQERQKIEKELACQNKISPDQKEALLWQKEKSLLALHVEMLQKEQAEAERDLEELYQDYQHETEVQKDHILQVFQAYRRHAEEQTEALEQRYRKLLRESLRDAIILSAQNQQLRVQKELRYIERAIQTDPCP
ncbi:uncharacterized protein LOC110082121 isoform X1 [Pogona vitticeps]